MEGKVEEWWEIWGVRALDSWAYRRENGHLSRGMCVCGDLLCIWVVGSRMLFVEKEWQEGSAATNLSRVHKRLTLWEISWELGILLIWVQSLRRLWERRASRSWVSRCWEWEQCIKGFRGCGLVAQGTEWTQRDLTSKASPEVPVGSKIMCIVDRAWDGSWVVNPMSSTRIYTQWSDVLIFVWVNDFCWRIRVLCVDVFCELLEWGLV